MGTAFWNFESTFQKFLTNGWGYRWHGDPNCGVGRQQPGGWTCQILHHLEQDSFGDFGSGLPDAEWQPLTDCLTGRVSPPNMEGEIAYANRKSVLSFTCLSKSDLMIQSPNGVA